MPEILSAWIRMEEIPTDRKTKVWAVVSKSQGSTLGTIKWHGAWRTYCFFPSPDCLFSSGCLTDITSWIDQAMKERRARS